MSAATVLDQFLDPLSRCLDAESARRVLALSVSASVQERVDTLAERANEGLPSDDERAEYEALINAEDFAAILKLKARRQLSDPMQRWSRRRGLVRTRARNCCECCLLPQDDYSFTHHIEHVLCR